MDEKAVTFLCGWLIDGKGGKAQKNAAVRIKAGRIEAVSAGTASLDQTARIIDYSEYTVIPGLVDAHIHLAMSGDTDPEIRKSQLSYGYESALPVMKKNIQEMLRYGIFGARDGGDAGGFALKFKEQILKESAFDFSAAGKGWHARERYGSFVGCAPEEGRLLSDAFKACGYRTDHLKVINSGINSLTRFGCRTPPQFSAADLKETVRTAVAKGLQVMVHANGEQPVKEAIEAGCSSIEHGYFMGTENLERLAEKGIIWVPTICPMAAVSKYLQACGQGNDVAERTLEHQLNQLRTAKRLGVVAATGTDAGSLGVLHGISLLRELELFVEAGYNMEKAIACSSVNGRKLLKTDRKGIIEKGAAVNMVAAFGSPEEVLSSLEKVEFSVLG